MKLKQAKPIIVYLTNTSAISVVTTNIFGFNDNFNQPYLGLDPTFAGISRITTTGSTAPYTRIIGQSGNKPFRVGKWRVICNSSAELRSTVVVINKVDANGRAIQDPVVVDLFEDSFQSLHEFVDIKKYPFEIDGNTYLSISMLPLQELALVLFPSDIADQSRELYGKNILKKFSENNLKFSNEMNDILIELHSPKK